ncbi:MAG: hypothetical protein A2710_07760 [Burkholderiales bacterium RIFCSPHIGHO2_01_FULL_64_960]|nr:MAG: hypothetical protein A2710_07760 [Burkholderiales bacterium RIFCSPHIGHO2_01_FULL_64_960]
MKGKTLANVVDQVFHTIPWRRTNGCKPAFCSPNWHLVHTDGDHIKSMHLGLNIAVDHFSQIAFWQSHPAELDGRVQFFKLIAESAQLQHVAVIDGSHYQCHRSFRCPKIRRRNLDP